MMLTSKRCAPWVMVFLLSALLLAPPGCKSATAPTTVPPAGEVAPPSTTNEVPAANTAADIVGNGPDDAGASKADTDTDTAADAGPDNPPKVVKRRVFTDKLPDRETFEAYSRQVGTERFTKFIVDVRTNEIYFFDVNVYKLHVEFAFQEIYKRPQTNDALIEFNRNYEQDKPEFLLCYLVHHTDIDEWTMAFWEGDLATDRHVANAYKRMKAGFYLGSKVKFRPDSTLQEELLGKPGLAGIPTITNDKIYKSAPYQAFTTGRSVGRLRIIRSVGSAGKAPKGNATGARRPEANTIAVPLNFSDEEIVILTDVLPDITPVRGIISERFSTPLAHVALRARAWGIPHVGFKNAATKFAALDGKWVHFDAQKATATIRLATKGELAADRLKRSKARTVRLPTADLKEHALKWLPSIRATAAGAYGAKTANLGEIAFANMPGFSVPTGFGVPVAYYSEHMITHGLDVMAKTLMANPRFQKDPQFRTDELKKLRAAIVAKPLAKGLLKQLQRNLGKLPGGARRAVFVRSSTNAEDLPGFNGAGLYDTVPNVGGAKNIVAALKQVWASVWNKRAYEERAHFGINHAGVYGAALIQVGVNATAAGVLVTANIYDREDTKSYTINAKGGLGIRVVEGKKIPEQLIFDLSNFGIKVLSRSDEDTMLVFDRAGGVKEVPNPHKGKPVLTDERAMRLALTAKSLTRLFPPDKPLDIEWLFEGDTLHIVQSRPYIGL